MRGCVRLTDVALLAALTIWAVRGVAQVDPLHGARKSRAGGSDRSPAVQADSALDVLHYDINLRLDLNDGSLAGKVSILARMLGTTVDLHAAALQIDTVRVNGQPATWSSTGTETIRLDPGRPVSAGETLGVEIGYRRLPGVTRPAWRDGYYWFSKDSVPGLPASLGYTMSEPSDTRYWLPCHDQPWDKATADLAITVRTGVAAASNGRLIGAFANGDSTTTWRWHESHQIAPYLLCITASEFAVSGLPFVRSAGDTIPLQYWTWRGDSAVASGFLPIVKTMMEMLSARFGPYPFAKYGMTAIAPFGYGGMEHQTITTMHRALMTDSSVVVHEFSHQWWGDLVTCATWEDIWLNEGFASYCEVLWEEFRGGAARRNTYLNTQFDDFGTASWEGAIYDPVSQGFDMFCSAVYTKAAWVMHTLRGVIGDSLFFRSLLAYRARFTEGNATTEQFRAVVDSVTGRDMRWFFQQWIYGRGWPEYRYSWNWQAGVLHVTVQQVQQSNFWPAYRMPIQIRASFGPADTLLVLQDSLRIQDFSVPLSAQPVAVEFDPDNWILKRMKGPVVGVPPETAPLVTDLEQNYPNPFNGVSEIGWRISSARPAGGEFASVKLQVFDLLGREVATLVNENRPPGSYSSRFDASTLASGVYVYRLSVGGRFLSRTMILIR